MIRLAFAYAGCFAFTVVLVCGATALLAYARWHEEP